jgi:hypothetical protein
MPCNCSARRSHQLASEDLKNAVIAAYEAKSDASARLLLGIADGKQEKRH